MEFQLAVTGQPDSHQFSIIVEPEAMTYEFPAAGKVVLTFRGPDSMLAELTHHPGLLVIWRPPDTEVWAGTADGENEQIGGFAGNPAPGFDTGGKRLDRPLRETVERIFYDRPPPDSSSR